MDIEHGENSDGHEIIEVTGESDEIVEALGDFPKCLKFVQEEGGWTYEDSRGSTNRRKKKRKWSRVTHRMDSFKLRKREDRAGGPTYRVFVSTAPFGGHEYKTHFPERKIEDRLSMIESERLKKEILIMIA